MKTKTTQPNNLIEEGKNNWERTDEYNNKVNEIRRELLGSTRPFCRLKRTGSSDKSSRFALGLK
jgi:hypothetical protein